MTESPQIRAIIEPDLGYKFKMCLIRFFSFEAVFWNLISSAVLSAILLLFVFDERMLDLYGFRLILITVGFTILAFPLVLVIYSLKGKEKRVEYFFDDNGMSIIAADYKIICFWKYLKRVRKIKTFSL